MSQTTIGMRGFIEVVEKGGWWICLISHVVLFGDWSYDNEVENRLMVRAMWSPFVRKGMLTKGRNFFEVGKITGNNNRWGNMGEAVVRHEPGKYSQVTTWDNINNEYKRRQKVKTSAIGFQSARIVLLVISGILIGEGDYSSKFLQSNTGNGQ